MSSKVAGIRWVSRSCPSEGFGFLDLVELIFQSEEERWPDGAAFMVSSPLLYP